MRVGIEQVREAAALLSGVATRTPVLSSVALGVRFKAEHLQRTGSFKVRGAYARIAKLAPGTHVVAASAGNHAQGVAFAASRLGARSTVVMPVYASLPKVEATRSYGAEIILHGDTFDDSLVHARSLEGTFVHAFDDPWVIAGQGTVGLEICEDAPGVDRIVVPVGGGGLVAGVATAVKALSPGTAVIGVRAASAPTTIADGAGVRSVGALTGEIAGRLVDEMVSVDEEAISEAIVMFLERTKQVVEGAGALGLAAVLSGAVPRSQGTLIIASGGNIDPGLLMRVIRHGLSTAGRYLFLRVRLRDRPGQLRGVLGLLAELRVNVVSIVHHRAGLTMPVDDVEVELTLETRDRDHAREVVKALEAAGHQPML